MESGVPLARIIEHFGLVDFTHLIAASLDV
jgi:hypothetical protein